MGDFLTVATTALKVAAIRQEVGAKKVEINLAKRGEADAARDRELQRRRRTVAILGAQSASAAAKGISVSGSVANISLEDARRAGEESLIDRVNTEGRISALSRRSTSIKRLGRLQTATTIFSGAQKIADRGKTPEPAAASGGGK